MSNKIIKKLNRYHVGELPLLEAVSKKICLKSILNDFLPKKKNAEISPADTLMLLIYNLAKGKNPLYELEDWIKSIDTRCLNLEKYKDFRFTDDRLGNALDELYAVDRASLMTRIVLEVIKKFDLDITQIHNDSTTVSAFGQYPGKTSTSFELKKGKSKDRRPDLKQLVFCLSISADGAVPIHYKAYPGNRNDDTTHIETWDTLAKIAPKPNFLYVADCKLCSDTQLSYIVEKGGRAITVIPDFWKEVVLFKESQRIKPTSRKEILRRLNEKSNKTNYFSACEGEYKTNKRGYRIHWIYSSSKRQDDYDCRMEQVKKTECELETLRRGLNKKDLISEKEIRKTCDKILKNRKLDKFITVDINQTIERHTVKSGRGRPSPKVVHQTIEKSIFSITWSKNKEAMEAEKHIDGLYPLLSTDPTLSAKEVLIAYKFQPKLEKRFSQFKSVQNAAPLLFKKVERIESNMFLFFIALMMQALIEREVRLKMKDCGLKALEVYPEKRDATHPTTTKIFDIFDEVSTYTISKDDDILEEYADELNDVQKSILNFLSINESQYWNGISKTT